jgi:outer membrane receptor protein involved in Fe transport
MSSKRVLFVSAALAAAGLAPQARAQSTPAGSAIMPEVVVTARRLDAARDDIQPALGATTYSMPQAFIENLPAGANTQLNQVILQAPGAAQDSFGQLHIRGDHGDIQYRLNNVILPEGLQGFGQTLSPRLASNIQLITGALPAQYGLRTAGIINITAKSGFDNKGELTVYGGSHGEIEPSIEYGGSGQNWNGFFSGSYTGTDVGIESPDGRANPLHDHSDQYQAFGYLDHTLDADTRVSLIAGTSQQSFEIPNIAGLQPELGYNVDGRSDFASENLDQRQREGTTYAIASLLKTTDRFTGQASLTARYSELTYTPDVLGELLFNGIAQAAHKTDLTIGGQFEGVYRLNDAHTLRGGIIISTDRTTSKTNSQVFALDAEGAQIGSEPITIVDDNNATAWSYSAYLQDEWSITPTLTLNYGLRFDLVDAYRREDQLSSRINLVWKPTDTTTLHAGFARYFTPPPFELVADTTVAKFEGTSAQAPGTENNLPRSERDSYFDIGAQQRVGKFTLSVDGYYKRARNLLDEGQFGAPIILTPFNYAEGYAKGVEFSVNYAAGPLTAYANLAIAEAKGKNIVSSEFNFDPEDLAYIEGHDIYLDHNQTYTVSAGGTYHLGPARFSADLIYGSGLRRDGQVPNGDTVSSYVQANIGYAQDFKIAGGLTMRADIINLFDSVYEIRDGTGIGVGAPQFGPRRGFYGGVTKTF